jgi:tRNA uridine 5-carboxymethylaminomethyl modification enzyme
MFTGRAEYRLGLNHGSAELRLQDKAERWHCLPPARLELIREKRRRVQGWVEQLEREAGDQIRRSYCQDAGVLPALPQRFMEQSTAVREEVLYRICYRGYLDREAKHIERCRWLEVIQIPKDFDYQVVRGLRREGLQKLQAVRPQTLGQASRISGVNPADIQILMVALKAEEQVH